MRAWAGRRSKGWAWARRFAVNFLGAVGVLLLLKELAGEFWAAGSWERWAAGAALAVAMTWGVARAARRSIRAELRRPVVTFEILEGDLFDSSDADIVVPFSDTFDVSPPAIAETSVQGQFLERVFGGDGVALTAEITKQLTPHPVVREVSKEGNRLGYAIGTAVVVPEGKRNFYLVALAHMDEQNKASATPDDLWQYLDGVWSVARASTNDRALRMALPGGGRSGLSNYLAAPEVAALVVLSYLAYSRGRQTAQRLELVVPPEVFEQLEDAGIRQFLETATR